MTLRLTEIHPSVVHLPIALTPTALALDAIGAAAGSKGMMNAGRLLIGAAFASAMAAAVTGALAQGASRIENEEANDLLTTHRTMNVALGVLLGGMAAERAVVRKPGRGYFAVGLLALGAMGYSAYLGGRMSYEHGVGVARADGLREKATIGRDSITDVVEATVAAIGRALQQSWDDIKAGRFLPALRPGSSTPRGYERVPARPEPAEMASVG
ncbi:DUF2231 domain-containing protein [Roseomonas sp. CCTCC AB2023176]|uniref:DUF2231 domain-containing protein n=1 Tax=Roseomonas sp. CCTCC AB2023176 TaxID=3342640 RepID=UPI0035D5FD5C